MRQKPNTLISRAAMMLLMMLLTATTAWAQEPVSYIDENGETQSCSTYTELRSTLFEGDNKMDNTDMPSGWYVVKNWNEDEGVNDGIDFDYNSSLRFQSHAHIILCDGATMRVSLSGTCISSTGTLAIYGQTEGTGTLIASNTSENEAKAIAGNAVTINGGTVNATIAATDNSSRAIAINTSWGDVTINGGTVTANAGGSAYALYGYDVHILGGNVTANGTVGTNTSSGGGIITLGWRHATDQITATAYEGTTVKIADGQYLCNGTDLLCSTVSDMSLLSNKTLVNQITYTDGNGDPQTTPIDWATVSTGTSASDPYYIYHSAQLQLLAFRVNGTHDETANDYTGKYFKLGADIAFSDDYAENYEAIGRYYGSFYYFKGDFNGDGHTVRGIRIRKKIDNYDTSNRYQGLFGIIDNGANIHDVHVTDALIQGNSSIGGIVGQNNDCTVSGCTVTNSVITADSDAGFICGYNSNSGTLSHNYYYGCTANGTAATVGNGCKGADVTKDYGAVLATLGDAPDHFLMNADGSYTIKTALGWNLFCDLLATEASGYFTGKTVKLGADITVTRMAGDSSHRFTGTFNGDGHTLTVNYTATADGCAPFLYIDGATIKYLKVTGTISTGYKYAAGIAAHSYGTSTIQNCWSNVAISTTISGDGTHAGLVAVLESGGSLSITNCLFDGSISGGSTTNCGGLVGWRNATLTFNNCMMAGTMAISQTDGSALFNRNGGSTLTKCYYDGSKSYGSITVQGFSTTATGETLRAQLGSQWEVSGDKVVPVISSRNLTLATVSDVNTLYFYTGSDISITPVVTDADGTTLTSGTDYTVTIKKGDDVVTSVTAVGDYTLTITGTGTESNGYYGSKSITFFVTEVISGSGTISSPYLIGSIADWIQFSNPDNAGTYWESGVYVRLTADIGTAQTPITTMAGTSDNKFKGTFFGDGHTMTVNYTATADGCAPFLYIDGATINTLKVTGTISTGYKYAAGIAAHSYGTSSIRNCWSNVAIYTSISGDGTHAGLVAVLDGGSLSVTNCLFDGSISGGSTTNCGGLVGWRNATLAFNNCMMAGSMDISQTNGSALFNRNGSSTLTNCYYDGSKSYGSITAQGTSATATGSDLQALLGAGWTVSGGKAVPIMDATNLATAAISGIDARYCRTKGTELKPEPVVTAADGKVLSKDQDYTVEWSGDGKADGTYTVTIIGTGGYVGSQTISYFVSIAPLWLSIDTNKQPGDEGYYYVNMNTSGTVGCEIPDGFEEQFMVRWSHDNSTETGTMTLTVPSGRKMVYSGEWSGSQYSPDCYYYIKEGSTTIYGGYNSRTFDETTTTGSSLTITCQHKGVLGELTLYVNMKADPICISDLSAFYAYTGSTVSVTPTVRDADADKTLTAGTDYDLTFTPATVKDKGVYTATFSGKGDYSFTKTMNFLVGTLDYIDADGSTQSKTLSDITLLTNRDDLPGTLTGWYLVADNISFNSRPSVSGNAHLILADGATMTSNYGCTVTDGNTLNIYGQAGGTGTLTVRANSGYAAIGGTSNNNGGTITINGGQVTATGGSGAKGFSTSGTITLSLRKTTDFITSNGYDGTVNIKSGLRLTDGTNFYSGNDVCIPNDATLRQANFTVNAAGTEYTIHTTAGWDMFCDALQDNDTYNRFSGKTVYLSADITVTRMAGTSNHDFCGTFDGQGYTLTFNYGTADSPYTAEYLAPFCYVSNAKANPSDTEDSPAAIRNLHVNGDIYTSAKYAAGFISREWGTVSITNCRSSVNIHSSVSGDGTHGGFVSGINSDALTIEGCLFDGKLLTTNRTTHCGGFVGWNSGKLTICNSLYAPATPGVGETWVGTTESATFARGTEPTITNSYYTAPPSGGWGATQGKQCRSIMAGEGVTLSHAGEVTTYAVSGIKAYKASAESSTFMAGLLYNNEVLYAGNGEAVSLTLSNTPPTGYAFGGYTASPDGATLSEDGDNYTLTMPEANVTIGATFEDLTIIYIDGNGVVQYKQPGEYTVLTGGGATTLSAGWYVVNSDIDYTGTITLDGDVNIILCDGKTMNIGKSDSPVNGKCIHGSNGFYIYGQSLDHAIAGHLNVYNSNQFCMYVYTDYKQYSGNVTLNTIGTNSHGIVCDRASIYGGALKIKTADAYGIYASSAIYIYGGQVDAQAGGSNMYGLYTSRDIITLGWTNPSDFIYANRYKGTVTIADGKAFYNSSEVLSGTFSDMDKVNGKTLTPALALADNADNTSAIATAATACTGDKTLAVQLADRTLWKDGAWNTLCLPFDLGDDKADEGHHFDGTPLAGATVMELDTESNYDGKQTGLDDSDGTLYLYFKNANKIVAGTPYIIKWDGDGTDNLVNPVFTGVTIKVDMYDAAFSGGSFKGTYAKQEYTTENKSILFLGTANTLYYPQSGATIGAQRAYFQIADDVDVKAFNLNFGDDYATSIEEIVNWTRYALGSSKKLSNCKSSDAWFDLNGRRLDGKPSRKGLYIYKGKKVVVK